MAQMQPSQPVRTSLRFPIRLAIVVVVVTGAIALYVSQLDKEVPFDVLISIGDEPLRQVQTVGGSVQSVLAIAGVEVSAYDRVSPDLDDYVEPDTHITIERATPVRITVDGTESQHWVIAETVQGALDQVGISLGPLDRITPARGAALTEETAIQIVRVVEEFVEEVETLPFKVVRWAAPELERGQTKVVREGQEGIIKKTVRVVYEDGKPVNRTIVGSEVIQPVVDRIIGEGTRTPSLAIDTPHGRFPYVEVREMVATGYEPGPVSTGEWADGLTFTGIKAERGVVAVDPTVIPLGTRLYIEGYGEGIAADIGGAIKGNRIDLCFDTYEEAIQWGRRTVKVYILAD